MRKREENVVGFLNEDVVRGVGQQPCPCGREESRVKPFSGLLRFALICVGGIGDELTRWAAQKALQCELFMARTSGS